ncbi:MAG: bacteriorhodopsin [Halobacteriaceae archaeon]
MTLDLGITHALGTAGMAIGTALIAVGYRDALETHPLRYLSLVGVTGIATVAYVLMTVGVGAVTVGGYEVYVTRYVDWLLTTPLLLLYAGLLASASRRVVVAALAANAVVIGLGTAAALTTGPVKIVSFAVASLAFAVELSLLFGPITATARANADADRRLFVKLRNVIGVLWPIYPVVWLVGPPGVGLMTTEMAALVIVYIDLVTKVGFGLIVLNAHGAFDWIAGGDAPAGSGAGEDAVARSDGGHETAAFDWGSGAAEDAGAGDDPEDG